MLSLLTGATPPIQIPPSLIPTPPAIIQKAEPQKIKIIQGDTLTKIAKEKNVTVERLFDKNLNLTNPDILKVGDEIIIPEASEVLESRIPPVAAENPSKAPQSGSTGLNGYAYPSCTGHVALKRYVPPGWGNASDWKYHAQNAGWTVSNTPVAGAIGWRPGHVVYVESVNPDGSITISENNYDWNGSTRTITISPAQYQYIY